MATDLPKNDQPHSPLLLAEIAEMAERAPQLDFSAWFVRPMVSPAPAAPESSEDEEGAADA